MPVSINLLGGGADGRFESIFPMELEGRITPAVFQAVIADINVHLTDAYSVRGAVLDNLIAVGTWWTSLVWRTSHFERVCRTELA